MKIPRFHITKFGYDPVKHVLFFYEAPLTPKEKWPYEFIIEGDTCSIMFRNYGRADFPGEPSIYAPFGREDGNDLTYSQRTLSIFIYSDA